VSNTGADLVASTLLETRTYLSRLADITQVPIPDGLPIRAA